MSRASRPAGRAGPAPVAVVALLLAVGCGSPPPADPAPATPVATPVAAASIPPAGPPAARMALPDGAVIVGQLGAYTWRDAGAASPWLRGAPGSATPGETLEIVLEGGAPIESWTIQAAPDGPLAAGGPPPGAVRIASGQGRILFEPPAPGRWMVGLQIVFADGLGDAAYHWLLTTD